MIFLEVAAEYPALITRRIAVAEEAPASLPITGGLAVDLGLFRFGPVSLVTTITGRGYGASWEGTFPVEARLWGLSADFGARFAPQEDRTVTPWGGVGTGLRGEWLDVEYWEDIGTVGLGAWAGGGVAFGRGKVQATLAARADLTLRVDSWAGTVITGDGTTTWQYWPGSARIVVQAGARFR